MPPSSLGGLRWLARYASTTAKPSHKRSAAKHLQQPLPLPLSSSSSPYAQTVKKKPGRIYLPRSSTKLAVEEEEAASGSTVRNVRRRSVLSHYLDPLRDTWRASIRSRLRPEIRRSIWKAWWILPWLPIFLVFDEHFFTVMRVNGPSMVPTLNADFAHDEPNAEDHVLVNLMRPGRNVVRGDIVAFRSPQDPERIVMKRVVAVQGDMVQPLPPYPTEPLIVQWGQVWVEGDNEDKTKTKDSNTYGAIPQGLIVGTVKAILWPLGHIKWLTAADWKPGPRVSRRAVKLLDPDVVDSQKEAYWKAKKAEANGGQSRQSDLADDAAARAALREIETA